MLPDGPLPLLLQEVRISLDIFAQFRWHGQLELVVVWDEAFITVMQDLARSEEMTWIRMNIPKLGGWFDAVGARLAQGQYEDEFVLPRYSIGAARSILINLKLYYWAKARDL